MDDGATGASGSQCGLTPGWNPDGTRAEAGPTLPERVAKIEETLSLLERVQALECQLADLAEYSRAGELAFIELEKRVSAAETFLRGRS